MPERVEVPSMQVALEKLEVAPGDVLVLRTDYQLDQHETERARDLLLQVLEVAGITEVGVLVTGPDVELSVESHG